MAPYIDGITQTSANLPYMSFPLLHMTKGK